MSDTPRLTRRQLREMGKLETRPADEVGVDETGVLRLDRPSRRELREQQEGDSADGGAVGDEATESDQADSPVAPEESAAPEDSVASDESAAPVAPEGAAGEAEAADPVVADVDGANDGLADEFDDEQPTQIADAIDPDEQPTQIADAIDPDELPSVAPTDTADSDSATSGAAPDGDETPDRKSVFDRFESDAEPNPTESSPDDVHPDALEEDHGDKSLNERLVAMTARNRTDYEQEAERLRAETETPANGVGDAPASFETQSAPTAQTAPANSQEIADSHVAEADGEAFDDYEQPSRGRTIVGWILLILIGVIVGYLIGTWISNTYLAAAPVLDPSVVVAAERLL